METGERRFRYKIVHNGSVCTHKYKKKTACGCRYKSRVVVERPLGAPLSGDAHSAPDKRPLPPPSRRGPAPSLFTRACDWSAPRSPTLASLECRRRAANQRGAARLSLVERSSEAFVSSRHSRTCHRSRFTVNINALTGSVPEY